MFQGPVISYAALLREGLLKPDFAGGRALGEGGACGQRRLAVRERLAA